MKFESVLDPKIQEMVDSYRMMQLNIVAAEGAEALKDPMYQQCGKEIAHLMMNFSRPRITMSKEEHAQWRALGEK